MRYETVQTLLINDKHWSKLTGYIDDVWVFDSQYASSKKMNREIYMKHFTRYWGIGNTEVNLPTVLVTSELLIHIIIKENEAWDMKQLTKYWVTTSTEVRLHTVLTMCELFICNLIKNSEAWDMQQFTSYPLTTSTEVNLPTVLM